MSEEEKTFTVIGYIQGIPENPWVKIMDIQFNQIGATVQKTLEEEPRLVRITVQEQAREATK